MAEACQSTTGIFSGFNLHKVFAKLVSDDHMEQTQAFHNTLILLVSERKDAWNLI